MEASETGVIFPAPPPGSETFQRVWSRVMAEAKPPSSGALPAPLSCPRPEASPAAPDRDFLIPLLELSARRTAALRAMVRRGGSAARGLSGLTSQCRTQFCRLSTAHFLITGQRYRPKVSPPPLSGDPDLDLRDRWLECVQWQSLCEKIGRSTAEPVLSQLLQDLRREASGQAAALRSLLEKRCSPP